MMFPPLANLSLAMFGGMSFSAFVAYITGPFGGVVAFSIIAIFLWRRMGRIEKEREAEVKYLKEQNHLLLNKLDAQHKDLIQQLKNCSGCKK